MQKLGAQFARAVNDMFTLPISELAYRAFIGFVGVLKEVFVDSWIAIGRDLGTAFMTYVYNPLTAWVATPIANAWQWIVDTFWAAVSWVQSLIDTVKGWISKWVTTPIANAWQWILDTFWNTIGVFQTYMDTVTGWITKFVTTPIANAWQWIKDTFWAVVKSLGIGGAGGSGGGNTGENAGGNASLNPVDSIQGVVRDIQTREQKRDDIMREIIRGIEDSQRHALGGLLGGRGTGTSDSNLAWVSRGEHIMPAAAVRQPGVLAFLEALRRSGGNLSRVLDGLGRFAMGGLVSMPAFAAGGGVGGMSHVTIAFPGLAPISGLRASSAVVEELQRAAATAQVRSGGRKPSRYT